MKSDLAIKRDDWFASDEGQKCMSRETYSLGEKYMKNRMELAFLAGAKAGEEVLANKINQIMLSHKLDGKYTEKEALVKIAKILTSN